MGGSYRRGDQGGKELQQRERLFVGVGGGRDYVRQRAGVGQREVRERLRRVREEGPVRVGRGQRAQEGCAEVGAGRLGERLQGGEEVRLSKYIQFGGGEGSVSSLLLR